MNIRKLLGDVAFVVIVIVIALTVFGSRQPGPVEVASNLLEEQHEGHTHDGMAEMGNSPMMHRFVEHSITDGDPLISLGGNYIGRDWFDESVELQLMLLASEELDDVSASKLAELITIEEGLLSLITGKILDDYGISFDSVEVDSRMDDYFSNFDTREKAERNANQMGMTLDQLRSRWEEDSIENRLRDFFAEERGVSRDSAEFEDAYFSWLKDNVLSADWVFEIPEFEELFNEFVEAVTLIRSEVEEEQSVENTVQQEDADVNQS